MTLSPATTVAASPAVTLNFDADLAVVAASSLLTALGVDTTGEHLRDTAARMVASYQELLTPTPFGATTFENSRPQHGLVIVRDVPFAALCAHHVLPFLGRATVGYEPGNRLLGLSKLARIVDQRARGLQVQEDMTEDIANDVARAGVDAAAVGVIIRADHLCMSLRGARARGASTVTTAWRGAFVENAMRRAEFFALVADR